METTRNETIKIPFSQLKTSLSEQLRFLITENGKKNGLQLTKDSVYIAIRHKRRQPDVLQCWIPANHLLPPGEQLNEALLSRLKALGFQLEFLGKRQDHCLEWDTSIDPIDILTERLLAVLEEVLVAAADAPIHLETYSDTVPMSSRFVIVLILLGLIGVTLLVIYIRLQPFYAVYQWLGGSSSPLWSGAAVFAAVSWGSLLVVWLTSLGAKIVRK